MSESGHQEVVMFFDAEEEICGELHFSVFNKHLEGESRLEGCAASVTKAAYCVIGDGLSLRGVAFFQFSVDEEGVIDPSFNLPLPYLVQHAGLAEDLGQGPIRQASRSQCPVPWHALNLWEPQLADMLEVLQNRIFRNRLKLLPSTACRDEDFFPAPEEPMELYDNHHGDADEAYGQIEADSSELSFQPTRRNGRNHNNGRAQPEAAGKLKDAFGAQGKVSMQEMIRLHTEQLDDVKNQYRDQLKAYRDEIHELKVALRQEQGRNRRLQELLRGDL